MYKITGFTTKKPILPQLEKSGAPFNINFSGKDIKVKKNPLEKFELRDKKGKKQKLIKDTKI